MKKVWQILAVAVMALVPLAASDSALAAEGWTCRVGFTGPDSHNLCTSEKKYECTVVNENKVEVKNENVQIAKTGDADNSGNTGGGGAWTGSAKNENGATFNVEVNNEGECEVVKVTAPAIPPAKPPVKKPVVTPVKPGHHAGRGAVTPPQQQAPSVLPNTSGDSTMSYLAALVGALGIGTVVSRLAVATYSRMKS